MSNPNILDASEESPAAIESEIIYPSLVTRVKAHMTDMLVLMLMLAVISQALDSFPDTPDFIKGLLFVTMFVLYDPLLVSMYGQTVGKKITGIKVRRFSNEDKKLSLFHAIIRAIFKYSLGWISLLTVTSQTEKRALHDMVSGAIVLNA